MHRTREFLREHALTTGLIGLVGLMAIFHFLAGMGGSSSLSQCLPEALIAALTVAYVALIAGGDAVRPSNQGMGFALHKSFYLLIITIALGLVTVVGLLAERTGLASGWLGEVLSAALLCVFVGIFEEGLFRGVVLNSLLGRMGDTRTGLIWAVTISSILFGFVHVMYQVANPSSMTPLMWAQSLGKTIQTGMMGFLMATLYLKTHNIWSVALVHGLNDFILIGAVSMFGQTLAGSYVSSSSDGLSGLIVYVVFSILYIPLIVTSVRILKRIELPADGFLKEHWDTREGIELAEDTRTKRDGSEKRHGTGKRDEAADNASR